MQRAHRRSLLCTRPRNLRRYGRDRPQPSLRKLEMPRQELLQRELALVACRLDQRSRVLLCEMRGNQADAGQMKPPFRDRMEESRELTGRTSGLDAPLGRILGQAQLLDAVGV